MKKLFSLILGIVVISFIIVITIYTLKNRGIRDNDSEILDNKKIDLISSTYNNNVLSEIYNVYLNNEKHKIKFDYNLTIVPVTFETKAVLRVYFDGGNIIIQDIVDNALANDARGLFSNEIINEAVRIKLDDIQFLNIERNDYILLKVKFYDGREMAKYYLIDSSGEVLIKNGTTIKDNRIYYEIPKVEENVFLEDSLEEQYTGKFLDNIMYAMEVIEHEVEDSEEEVKRDMIKCMYYFKDGKLVREEMETYKNIKIKEVINTSGKINTIEKT